MHKNNFDFLRLLFSLFVIITHSYNLTGIKGDFLYDCTNRQLTFSDIALAGFFSISGFLVFQSLLTSTSLPQYLKRRVYRIYPGFIVALIVTVILGSVVSYLDFKTYFLNSDPWKFLYQKVFLLREFPDGIKGVFENNPYPGVVNGSLWTLPYEFLFYLLVIPFFFIKKKRLLITALLILFIVILISTRTNLSRSNVFYIILNFFLDHLTSLTDISFLHFILFFSVGCLLATFKKEVFRYKLFLLVFSLTLAVISLNWFAYSYTQYFFLPVTVISFGLMNTKHISGLSSKTGDLSYGVYLYGFLIQQTLMNYFKLKHWQLTLLSVPIALVFGFLSWNLVEKRFLMVKKGLAV